MSPAVKPKLIELASRQEQSELLANLFETELHQALQSRHYASFAVSGGGTPESFFTLLGQRDLDWGKICCLQVDERWLPDGHPDRNDALLKRSLFSGKASCCRYLPLKTHHNSPEQGQPELEKRLAGLTWPIDIVHLGMGEDGHTASWFRDAPEYRDLTTAPTGRCAATYPGAAPYPRMTLTPAAVLNSRKIVIQITGKHKLEVLEQALKNQGEYPIEVILEQKKTPVEIYWAP